MAKLTEDHGADAADKKPARPPPEAAEEELSEEDQKLKEDLDLLVERLVESNAELYPAALEQLKEAISSSTSSMTAVPKPLKFLRSHFHTLSGVYDKWGPGPLKAQLAAILSVVAMTAPVAASATEKLASVKSNEADTKTDKKPPTEGKAEGRQEGADVLAKERAGKATKGKQLARPRNETLKFRLLAGDNEDLAQWGHEYVRHLALEIGSEFHARVEEDRPTQDLLSLSLKVVPFLLKHNAEADAVDLLLEVDSIDRIVQFVDANTYARVCRYIVSCVPFLPPGDDLICLHTAYDIYIDQKQLPQALAIAIRLDKEELIRKVFDGTEDAAVRKQLAFMVARQRQYIGIDDEEIQEIISNLKLHDYYEYLTKELNLTEPKLPPEIYKSHLETSLLGTASLEPTKHSLASAFVNAFVNAGYGNDKMVQSEQEDNSWIYKTKGPGMQATAASIGLLNLWDFNNGLPVLDKYMYSSEEQIKAGSLLGIGVVNAGVHDDSDPAFALLADFLDNPSVPLRTAAIIGLGLSYAGSPREDLSELLTPLVVDTELPMEVSCLAALSLGLIFIGTADGDITSTIMQTFLEREAVHLSDKWTRFLALGLGLLYVGKIEDTEEILETIKAIDHPVATIVEIIVTICSYCGSGNVLQIQKLLRETATRPYEDEIDSDDESGDEEDAGLEGEVSLGDPGSTNPHSDDAGASLRGSQSDAAGDRDTVMDDGEAPAANEAEDKAARREARRESMKVKAYCVLGIAVIAMGEDIGQEMVLRHFEHLMHYGDSHIRRAVPLAMGLVSASDPQMKVYDTLSRYSHDSDLEVAINAVFAMGLVGAGTNNARLAQLLRQLAAYYSRDPDTLFMVRVAQGLIHLGKGVLTLSPFNTDRQILSPVALGGLLIVSLALLSPKSFILSSNPQMLYYLTLPLQPRMLVTVNENLEPIKVSVRVGQAVDVVGQAGRPKTITGWVTHTTPVLLAVGERAELEDDEYIPLTSFLEGVVILRKNPDSTVQNDQ